MLRHRHRLLPLAGLVLAVLALGGCTDQALVDRVAELEAADERLRSSLTDLGAPDPADQARADAARAELESVAGRITDVEGAIDKLRADLDGQTLELDGRVTTTELQLDELDVELVQLRTDLNTLTDRVSLLEARLDAHEDDPFGHGG